MHARTTSLELPDQRGGSGDGRTASLDAEAVERALCHDLRGHLVTIRLLAEAAHADPDTPAQVARRLESLMGEVRAATDLVWGGLNRERRTEMLDIADVAAECVRSSRWWGRAHLVLGASSAPVVGDRVELRRIVDNLLENAVRAAGPGGLVRVLTSRRPPFGVAGSAEAVLAVEDSGRGFDVTLPWRPGSLGLQIVMNLVTGMGGRVHLGSSLEGGARVEVVLPVQ